jgi:hypothetical protein
MTADLNGNMLWARADHQSHVFIDFQIKILIGIHAGREIKIELGVDDVINRRGVGQIAVCRGQNRHLVSLKEI